MKAWDIGSLRSASAEYHRLLKQVEPFCLTVAQELGFDSVDNVSVCDNLVSFTMQWHGPRQASDSSSMSFSIDSLYEDPKELGQRFLAEQEKAKQEAAERQAERVLEEKKSQLAKLKAELEDNAVENSMRNGIEGGRPGAW